MGPMNLAAAVGHSGVLIISLIIGFFFGFILESAGFGDSRKLAGQFYFSENTVLKVMFTAIVVTALLLGFSSAFGFINLDGIYVNTTFLKSGILGGFIMGIGFIIGGYCPGTSLVSMATGKLDGIFFVIGAAFGISFFGETVGSFWTYFNTGSLGRFTLPELFGISYGTTLLLVVFLAVAMFFGFEWLHRKIYKTEHSPNTKYHIYGAAGLVGFALIIMIAGQPSLDQKYEKMGAKVHDKLKSRAIYIDPAELLSLSKNNLVRLHIWDVRNESDWNIFHIRGSERLDIENVKAEKKRIKSMPNNAVLVLAGNGERDATKGWKRLTALGANNLYILEGGINNWLKVYGASGEEHHHSAAHKNVAKAHASSQPTSMHATATSQPASQAVAHAASPKKHKKHHGHKCRALIVAPSLIANAKKDELGYRFIMPTGQKHAAADPDPHHLPKRDFKKKVKLKAKKKLSGGCG